MSICGITTKQRSERDPASLLTTFFATVFAARPDIGSHLHGFIERLVIQSLNPQLMWPNKPTVFFR